MLSSLFHRFGKIALIHLNFSSIHLVAINLYHTLQSLMVFDCLDLYSSALATCQS
jgi:hypothetical protein